MDQSAEDHRKELRLQPKATPVFDAGLVADKLRPVCDLPVPLLREYLQDLLRVARVPRLQLFAIKEFEGVEDCRALLTLHASCEPPDAVLRSQRAILLRDQDVEHGVVGTLVLEVGRKAD